VYFIIKNRYFFRESVLILKFLNIKSIYSF